MPHLLTSLPVSPPPTLATRSQVPTDDSHLHPHLKCLGVVTVAIATRFIGTDGSPVQFLGMNADPLYDSRHVKDLYLGADLAYSGRFTVPVLWDKKRNMIADNKSPGTHAWSCKVGGRRYGRRSAFYMNTGCKAEVDGMGAISRLSGCPFPKE